MSYVFNLGMEYDFLRVVSWDIQHYYSPIGKTTKTNAVIYYNDQFTANNWLLQGLRRGLIYSGQVLHTNEPVSLFLVRC